MSGWPQHPLRGLLVAQFFGAFNDNAWKLVVALLGIRYVAMEVGGEGPEFAAASQTQVTLAFVVFTVPLMLVSPFAGALNDRCSKSSVILVTKLAEIAIMGLGTLALVFDSHGTVLPLIVLGLMGVQSAVFSPAKYGILPEVVPHERLSAANGLLEMWTFVAIIAGTAGGGVLLELAGSATWLVGLFLVAAAAVGFLASLLVPSVPPARQQGGVLVTLQAAWRAIREDRVLWLAVLGSIFFWCLASSVGQDMLIYTKAHLGMSDSLSGLPLALLAVGIGGGAVLAGRLSGDKVEYGLIPLASLGIAVCLLSLGLFAPQLGGTLVLMVFLGMACGFFLVPVNALIQWRAPQSWRGGILAVTNSLVFGGIIAGSLGTYGFARLGLSVTDILLLASVATAAGTVWALWLVPEALLRFVLVLLTQTFYRLDVYGRHHVPAQGGALLVPNHVSLADGLFLIATVDRPIRFLVAEEYFENPFLKPFMRALGAISISTTGDPRSVLSALRAAGNRLDQGELLCLFPEGQITRTGQLLPFRRGFERIMRGRQVPVIPVQLDQVWGSIFSFSGGRVLSKAPERVPYRVTVIFGEPLPSTVKANEVREVVQLLGECAWQARKKHRRPLHHSFVRAMRRHPFRLAFADRTRPRVACWQALVGAILLARVLRPLWGGQTFAGILLPPSVGGALVNLAATLSGRVSVNLNYTVGLAGLESAAAQAGLRSVVSSRAFVSSAKVELPSGVETIWLEDLIKEAGIKDRAAAFLLAGLAPIRFLERMLSPTRITMDDPVAVIFSSGSTGDPKGVVLTHFNVDSNATAAAQVLGLGRDERTLGILPFFHSFGYTGTLWFSVLHGVGVAFHPSPLDAAAIGEIVRRYRVTILVTTPTFLQLYWRRCSPEQFGSLRLIIAGAEKLPEKLETAFEDRFGVRPLEGYGITECAPVIALNVRGFRAPGYFQAGHRRGYVGQPLPGVAVRVVDPETFEPLGANTPGMLLVKGPNVMAGYLGRDDLTAAVMRDGWYITGDIASVDEEGFIRITDRLARFSKIGGEMVPHGKIELELQKASGVESAVFAVTAVPDDRKGESLAVLHTLDDDSIATVIEKLTASGLSNLFIPRRDHFVHVESLPMLGTGKLNLREVKRIAMERLGKEALP